MTKVDLQDKIIVSGKEYLVTELVEKLTYVDEKKMVTFFKSINLTIPIDVRREAIQELLASKVKQTIIDRSHLADELGYKLTFFDRYTDSQLVNLVEFYNTKGEITTSYLATFWRHIIGYFVERGVSQEDFAALVKLATAAQRAKTQINTKEFNDGIKEIFHDDLGHIDGLSQEEFRPTVYHSTTLPELRQIGLKYGVNVPKRIKKTELLDIIFTELRDRKQLTPEFEIQLKSKNIMVLERYCKDNHILASTELKKEEIIEYILKNAEETRESYYVPTTAIVYEKVLTKEEATIVVEHEHAYEMDGIVEIGK